MTTSTFDAPAKRAIGSFYTWMSLAFVLTAFLGFVPTYWMPVAAGKFSANPVVHLHGILFFSWTLFVLFQTSLVSAGRVALHRSLGLAGISLATLLTVFGVLAALNSLRTAVAQNAATAGEAFLIVPLTVIVTFAVLFTLAVMNIRRPEFHKRYMLLATVSVLNAPVARPLLAWVFNLPPGPPPVWIMIPAGYLSYLLILAGMIYDWRTQGRPHTIYLVALPVLLLMAILMIPVSETAMWHSFARDFLALAGNPATAPA